MRFIPAARSSAWWLLAGASSILISVLMWIIRFVLLHQPFTGMHAFRFMILAVVLSFLFGFAGWIGAQRLWLLSNAGIVIGLILMAFYSRDLTGWQDLVSFFVFLEAVALSFIVGSIVEGAFLIWRLARR
ncbi:phosphoglycerol transferase MdoB-like AlkP superfamily enzyme [Paenibacillus castaneae]|uniref:hypothetical protein n=1 Tax=Paenibacillus castaneae TaxID=474957 RepID=UPI000C9AC54C|nr:hypothetical protein [Paenibacillus castaneae]NIK78266.1 phosphoglycerol transferase MdoB-like AlkP superfamily enzyme [Paenibacillus castaneae]